MATVKGNRTSVERLLRGLADAVDFTRAGLGNDVAGIIVEGVVDRSIGDQKAPDGSQWAPNKEPYASSPRKAGKPVGVLTGAMLSVQEVRGEAEIAPRRVTLRYGTAAATREVAGYFTEGRDGVQEPRPFYGLDEAIRGQVAGFLGEHLAEIVRRGR